MNPIVGYRLVGEGKELVDLPEPKGMYEYCLAENGVFLRAQRPGLSVCIPVTSTYEPGVRGLGRLETRIKLAARVPALMTRQLLERCRQFGNLENLFWLRRNEAQLWVAHEPKQVRSAMAVYPLDAFSEIGAQALIDLHSHHSMSAFFSGQDDRDEKGFRIYAVFGMIYQRPQIVVRVGVYGHFCRIPADEVFELPKGLYEAPEYSVVEEDAL